LTDERSKHQRYLRKKKTKVKAPKVLEEKKKKGQSTKGT
jgi:hypothetical protein